MTWSSPINMRRVAFASVSLSLLFLLAVVINRTLGSSPSDGTSAERTGVVASPSKLQSGNEIVALFIGSSTCGATRSPGMPEAIASMKRLLAKDAARRGERFAVIGVALDWSPLEGLKFLEVFGPFDEVISGRNWLNTAAVRYIWRDIAGAPTMPQVVVVRRSVTIHPTTIDIGEETLLARKTGADEIIAWVSSMGETNP